MFSPKSGSQNDVIAEGNEDAETTVKEGENSKFLGSKCSQQCNVH